MYVRPNPLRIAANPEFRVPDPVLRDFIPREGRLVENSNYWITRVREEDVVEGEEEMLPKKSDTKGNAK